MCNCEQQAELASLEAIYEGSRDVIVVFPDFEKPRDEGACPQLQAKFRSTGVSITIWLPEEYLAEDGAPVLPLFELSSKKPCPERLDFMAQELHTLAEPLCGSPVLFSWLEWLRTDAVTAFPPGALACSEAPSAEVALLERETEDFFDDIPSADPDEILRSAKCESCAIQLDSVSRVHLQACQHSFCPQCAATCSQVFTANQQIPHCPLASCRATAPELLQWNETPELWAIVSKRILSKSMPLQDCIVFCPRCEDRGMDMPVVVSVDASSRNCACFKCQHRFCSICRSPSHSGSCFDTPDRVKRMAKRRPPLTSEMAEQAAARAAEILEEELEWEQIILGELRTAAGFGDFVEYFHRLHREQIMSGLAAAFGPEVELKAVPLAPSVQERFMAKMSGAHIKPAFHGTDTRNYESIFSRGLLIPGYQNELQIAHGAAHGRGIYTANIDASWLSRGFCASSSMLVCAVRQENVTHVGDAMVVFDPDNVVPLFEGYLPEGASVRYQETSWSTGSALQAGVMQLQATRHASSKPPPGKPAPAKSATTAEAAPAKPAKKSKFLTRLAAKSKKH